MNSEDVNMEFTLKDFVKIFRVDKVGERIVKIIKNECQEKKDKEKEQMEKLKKQKMQTAQAIYEEKKEKAERIKREREMKALKRKEEEVTFINTMHDIYRKERHDKKEHCKETERMI